VINLNEDDLDTQSLISNFYITEPLVLNSKME
jgi:hypothetical protein